MSTPETADFQSLLATAHAAADRAGAVILPHFRTNSPADHKGGDLFDPVTIADREGEKAIRVVIEQAYPNHGITGEEGGTVREEAQDRWVIDPIDGTRSFMLGLPIWGTLIGLTREGEPLLGLMDQPFTGERFWSSESEAFFSHQGETRLMHTRSCTSLGEALLATTSTDFFTTDDEHRRFGDLTRAVRLRRFGGDCYNYCLLALGHIDLVVEAGLQPYDIIPLIPIIERAGGIVTTWEGGDVRKGGRVVAAGDRRIHQEAVKILSD
ncbi:MAG: histidinol-phosphatase [Alphaproteobacteria bacterium]|nr:histidinol-phosphatase [Alphaproteobacteria bacterium]